jgi:hypothetical protein
MACFNDKIILSPRVGIVDVASINDHHLFLFVIYYPNHMISNHLELM